ncbi:MAG: tRNA (N6-isopentenyl adenosine(37)-C2)-methylthiotransferase MiaB [Oscillospiraceae bacterium]|nr:tRNA (N6-isopentenyl adenosine(37)-C2)-methylthiotransferase MiaB [Oscillospiraceae bacterium]
MGERAKTVSAEEMGRQREFMELVRAENELLRKENGRQPSALVETYGCQQNEADSEQIRGMLRQMGYRFTDSQREADLIVMNTCAVRAHAEQRVLGNVGALTHAKRSNPDQIICLCGCMMQEGHMAEKMKRSFRHVDLVFGPHALWRFPELLQRRRAAGGRIFDVEDGPGRVAEGLPVYRQGKPKAFVSIMQGCNNFCSYCIVPYVRGRERSRMPEPILREVEMLVSEGYKEITLLGQNVNSYGKDIGAGVDFAGLLRRLNELPGEFLIRFMTSHPKDASLRLFQAMGDCAKVAPHLHLPFQAGNDRVLKAMNRGYTKADYLDLVREAREAVPGLVLTSDVIVGFPGETSREFEDTLDVLREVRFDALFTFLYSPREGTPAAKLPDPLSRAEKQENFDRLLNLQNEISARRHHAYVGRTLRVLVDGESGNEPYNLSARTAGGRLVHLSGDSRRIGSFVLAEITDASTWALFGAMKESLHENGVL